MSASRIAKIFKYWSVLPQLFKLLENIFQSRKDGYSREERKAIYEDFEDVLDAVGQV